jgi:hypothetical protein
VGGVGLVRSVSFRFGSVLVVKAVGLSDIVVKIGGFVSRSGILIVTSV